MLVFFCVVTSCATHKKSSTVKSSSSTTASSKTADGSSFDNAIVITEKTEMLGIRAEYNWLEKAYPDYKSKGQSLNYYKKKPFDIIHIITSNGLEKDVYFDISNFFGK